MARDLETLKDVLWRTFEEAVGKHSDCSIYSSNGLNEKMENRKGIAALAQAIVAVESEQRVRAEQESRFPSPIQGKPAA